MNANTTAEAPRAPRRTPREQSLIVFSASSSALSAPRRSPFVRGAPVASVSAVDKSSSLAVPIESIETAKQVNLRYVSDGKPGITRRKAGKSFAYFHPDGKRLRDKATLARIRSLVIPPAWTDVWICPTENGHLQAVGRDARGRKQYRYHPRYREARDEAKYEKTIDFAKALPRIHSRTNRDLTRKHLTREKVLAAIVRIMEKSLIRVGNEEYAKQNRSYGLTTLQDDHATVRNGSVRFEFTGKSGKEHEIDLDDPRLAKIVKQCQDLPGEELFQYLDPDGNVVDVKSEDVNEYIRSVAGEQFTAKDFRTWAGTVLAAMALRELSAFDSQAQAKRNIVAAVERVAARLGNTKAVCRKCYIHPAIIESYLDGSLARTLERAAERELRGSLGKLPPEEAAVLALLQQRLKSQANGQLDRSAGRGRHARSAR